MKLKATSTRGFFLLVAIFIIGFSSYGQTSVFELILGSTQFDQGNQVIVSSDSSYIVVGSSSGNSENLNDVLLIKVSQSGTLLWQKYLGTSFIEIGNSLVETSDGGIAITGYTNNSTSGDYKGLLMKADGNGNLLWTKTFGSGNWDFGYSILEDFYGNLVVAGSSIGEGSNLHDIVLFKFSATGDLIWEVPYFLPGSEIPKSMVQTYDSGFAFTGLYAEEASGDTGLIILKSNTLGFLQWVRFYGGDSTDYGMEIRNTNDSGFAVVGTTKSFGNLLFSDYYFLRCNSQGDTLWTKRDGAGITNIVGNSVLVREEGGYLIVGATDFVGSYDMFCQKIDGAGFWQSSQSFGGLGFESAISANKTLDSGFIVLGQTFSYGLGLPNIYLLKLNLQLNSSGLINIISSNQSVSLENSTKLLYINDGKLFFSINIEDSWEILDILGRRIDFGKGVYKDSGILLTNLKNGIYFFRFFNTTTSNFQSFKFSIFK